MLKVVGIFNPKNWKYLTSNKKEKEKEFMC